MLTPSLVVLLPACNEAEALSALLPAFAVTRAAWPDLTVIVVDDGSQDETAGVVRNFNQPWVRVIEHSRNLGLAQAMRTGFAAALAVSPPGALIATMDADNTHQPAELVLMRDKLDTGLDVVIASRFEPGAKMGGIPRYRQLFSHVLSLLFRLFAPIPHVKDYSCGFRLYRAAALRRAAERWGDQFVAEQGFACMSEILLKLALLPGLKFGETPMDLRYDRKPGPSKMKVWQNIKDTTALLWRYWWQR